MAFMALAIAVPESHADVPTAITAQPEGRVVTMKRSSTQFWQSGYENHYRDVQGVMTEAVFADNGDVYFKNYLSGMGNDRDVWIKGHKDGDVLTVELPQVVTGHAEGYGIAYYNGYAFEWNDAMPENPKLSQNQTITFTCKGDTLTQTDNRILGIGLSDDPQGPAAFAGFGDGACVYTPFALVPQTMPEGLRPQTWTMKSDNEDHRSLGVQVAFNADKVYIAGAVPAMPDATIIGIVDGDKITFAKEQYLGMYDRGYYIYFMPVRGYDMIDELVMSYDAKAGTMDAGTDEGFAANIGTEELFVIDSFRNVHLFTDSPVLGPVEPLAPQNVKFNVMPEAVWDIYGKSQLIFDLGARSTDGRDLDPAKMFYSVYKDDQLLTFNAEHAPSLGQDVTEINIEYSDGSMFDNYETRHYLTLWFDDATRVGVQAIYRDGNEVKRSAIIYSDGSSAEIADLAPDTKRPAVYYDLQGRRVEPNKGVYIRVQNGKATKIIR